MEKKQSALLAGVICVLLLCLTGVLVFGSMNRAAAEKNLNNLESEVKILRERQEKHQSELDAARKGEQRAESRLSELNSQITQLQSGLSLAESEAKAQKERADQLEQSLKTGQKLKTAYLTFDDGPSPNTLRVLQILKDKNVPATFFVMHTKYPQYMKNIVDEGHAIALHTYTHDFAAIYKSTDAFFQDLDKIAALVKEQTGQSPRIIRFAGGSSNMISKNYSKGIMTALTKQVTDRGFRYFDWNVDSGDAQRDGVPAATLIQNVKNAAKGKDNVCVLMHDTAVKNTTVDALPEIIQHLKSENYHFASLNVTSPIFHHGINN